MIFCGQCGMQLAPGSTRCPRCGAAVDPTDVGVKKEELHQDDPTVASPSLLVRNQPLQPLPGNQPPLVLRPDGGSTYDVQSAGYEATRRVEAPDYRTGYPTQQSAGPVSYAGYPPQSGAYPNPTTPMAYPDYSQPLGSGGVYPTQGMSYSGLTPQMNTGYQQMPGQYGQEQQKASANSKGRVAAMIIIMVGLLFILTAVILFVVQQTAHA